MTFKGYDMMTAPLLPERGEAVSADTAFVCLDEAGETITVVVTSPVQPATGLQDYRWREGDQPQSGGHWRRGVADWEQVAEWHERRLR